MTLRIIFISNQSENEFDLKMVVVILNRYNMISPSTGLM